MAEFDAQAAEYDQHEAVHFLSSAVVHQLSSFSWLKTSMTILDYGCGTGITSLTLHDHGYAVVGADISSEMLNVFKGKCKDQVVEKYIPMILVEENEWNLPASQFDVVIMAFVLHHMSRENQRQLIMNVVETLQPNGRLCIFEFQDTARSRKAREGHKEGHHQDEHHRHRHHQDEAHVHHGEGRHHHHHHHHTHGEDSEVMQCVLEDAGLQVEITLFEVKLGKGQIMDCYAVVGTYKFIPQILLLLNDAFRCLIIVFLLKDVCKLSRILNIESKWRNFLQQQCKMP
jgi:ubiquinone/menaquinone biosynthesis C-methylase UbiE